MSYRYKVDHIYGPTSQLEWEINQALRTIDPALFVDIKYQREDDMASALIIYKENV